MPAAATHRIPTVGIDIGTTCVKVAEVADTGRLQPMANSQHQFATPAVVYLRDGVAMIGEQARDHCEAGLGDAARFFKAFLGRSRKRFALGGEMWAAEELTALLQRKVLGDLEAIQGRHERIRHCVLSVPAGFSARQRTALLNAAAIAGLKVLDQLDDPLAAALATGLLELPQPRLVIIYHLGGSSFEVSLVQAGGGTCRVLATSDDPHLGVRDWDERIVDFLTRTYHQRHGIDPRALPELLAACYRQVEQARVRLGRLEKTPLGIGHQGKALRVELSREYFDEMTFDLFKRTCGLLQETVENAGKRLTAIDEILVHGGGALLPALAEHLERFTQRPIRIATHPAETAAMGAARFAVMRQIERADADPEEPLPALSDAQIALHRRMARPDADLNRRA